MRLSNDGRAFLRTTGANAGDTERVYPSLPAVRNGVSLIRTKAAITATQQFQAILRNAARRRRFTPGGHAVGRIRELVRHDHTHPRISQAAHRNGPCLVLDLDVVRENYPTTRRCRTAACSTPSMKANPAPEVLKLLAGLGERFDVASVSRPDDAPAPLAPRPTASPMATPSRRRPRSRPLKLGVTLFAVDCEAEVERRRRAAPGSRVICRIHCDGSGSEWPLSRKFGCEPDYAADILELAHKRMVPHGIYPASARSSSNVEAWDRALASTAAIFRPAPSAASRWPWSISVAASAKYIRKMP